MSYTNGAHGDSPRPYTADEIRAMFLRHVWEMIDYWDSEKPDKREAMEGLAFSLLTALDGGLIQLPPFLVIPSSQPEDKEYLRSQGENWFPPFVVGDPEPCDIGGGLHEHFHNARRA